MPQRVYRLDIGSIGEPQMTPQGYLRTPAYVTRVGVFSYRMPDGTIRKELRPPDEVFDEASLKTLAGIPVTNDHPPEMLTAKNTRKYGVGYTGDSVEPDNIFVGTDLTITDQDTIDQVMDAEKPKRQTSCGYNTTIDETPGEFNGVHYDVVQRKIVYNHVAVVPAGRAGPDVRIKLDRFDAAMVDDDTSRMDVADHIQAAKAGATTRKTDKTGEGSMAKIKIDGMEYEATEVLGAKITEKLGQLDAATATIAKKDEALDAAKKAAEGLQGQVDALTADVQKKDKEIEAAKGAKPSRKDMIDLARARMDLEDFAKKALGADAEKVKFDEMDDLAIKKAVIAAVNPDMKLDSATEDYVNGCFSVILAAHKAGTEKNDELAEGLRNGAGRSTQTADPAAARVAMMKNDSQAWKQGVVEEKK